MTNQGILPRRDAIDKEASKEVLPLDTQSRQIRTEGKIPGRA